MTMQVGAPTAAGLYCRISQDREGEMLGVERQRGDGLELARSRGWPVADVYVDNDVSAYSGRSRPEYQRMLADLRAGRINAVIAWHPDRLHRSPIELEEFISVIEAAHAPVETVRAGVLDLSTPSGRVVARTLGAMARYESEHKAERISRKHEELAKAGRPILGGTRAFGMTQDYTSAVAEEATLIREAAARMLAGDSVRGICSDWQLRGVQTPTGGHWQQGPLRRMLISPRLAALRDHRGAIVGAGDWPAIIDRPTHERLRTILLDPARRTTTLGARSYLLTGMLRCGACGTRLVARPRIDHVRRYVCASGPATGGCGKIAILSEPLEALIEAAVVAAIDSPELERAIRDRARQDGGGNEVAALREDEAAMEQLARDHYVDRMIGRAEFIAARDALEARMKATRSRLARQTGTGALEAVSTGAARLWPSLGFDQRRSVIDAVVEDITIAPGRRGFNRFDPTRVDVAWRA